MSPEELQAIPVCLDSTPGRGINQPAEVNFQLIRGQPVRTAIEMFRNISNRTRINFDGIVTLPLQFQHSQVALVQFIKTDLFRIHGILFTS
jgi:hypothetical protein